MVTNWKQGMLRIWVVAAALWIAVMGWHQYQTAQNAQDSSFTVAIDDKELRIDASGIREEDHTQLLLQRLGWVFLPPLLLLLVFPIGGWLTRGFKPETK